MAVRTGFLVGTISLLLALPGTVNAQFSDADLEFFENKIRPMLIEQCAQCHGKEVEEPEGGFSIGSRAALLAGGDTGPAIVPGKPDESLLIESVNYDGSYEMPPSSKLDDKSIKLLTQWVEMGAPWPEHEDDEFTRRAEFDIEARKQEHWCWQPIASPEPPTIKQPDWAIDPIDNFVFQKIVGAGLEPASDATRQEWIRRVYFDLIGLPPNEQQIKRFVDDKSGNAFESVVDELLDSPHFGERWARHWMDLFRYAETYGHEFDYPIAHAHEYRDYLIRAFNSDVPYDDFIREHVAGDLIEKPRTHPKHKYNESILGTGFWFLGEATHGPVDVKADEAGRVDNQIDVVSKSFLGLTVACARCHDHKFDAISDEDYYALSGFLQSSRRQKALLDVGSKISKHLDDVKPKLHESRSCVKDFLGDVKDLDIDNVNLGAIANRKGAKDDKHPLHALHMAYVADVPDNLRKNTFKPYLKRLDTLQHQHDDFMNHSLLFEDFSNGVPEDWFVTGWAVDPQSRSGLQFSPSGSLLLNSGTVSSGRFGGKFYGVLRSPTFEITHDRIHIRARGSSAKIRLIIDGYELDIHNGLLFAGCRFDLSTPEDFQWIKMAGDIKNYRGHKAWLEFIDHGDSYFEIDEIRFANHPHGGPVDPPSVVGRQIAEYLTEHKESSVDQAVKQSLQKFLQNVDEYPEREAAQWLSFVAENSDPGSKLIDARKTIHDTTQPLPKPRLAIAMTEGTPENEHLFIRGNSSTLGQQLPRRFLAALSEYDEPDRYVGSGRMELANQIASSANPLTTRVAVNRIWHHLMGRGIVASVDNFGELGESPTHPQLLDYLATEFSADGWSIKRLIKRLVLSRTYRQSSELNESATEIDPENKLLHRANVRRLQGEAIRDSMLAISGSLDLKMFGKPVPIHLTEFMQGRGRPRAGGPLDGHGRRSIYLSVRRNFLSPMMLAFDTPIPFNAIGKRHQSNVPAQALIMMNDPFVIDQAAKWAGQLLKSTPDTDERISVAFRQAFGRVPNPDEIKMAQQFLDSQAKELDFEDDENLERQIWQDLCHVIFNMKEFIYIR